MTAFHAYFRCLFVTRLIVCILLVCLHGFCLKRAAFCENNFENVGIILRTIGQFKKNFQKE